MTSLLRFDAGAPVSSGVAPSVAIAQVASILVVDDANTVRRFHQHLLMEAGWKMTIAVNGVDALEKVLCQPGARPFDLYVVDVNMPKMDGLRLVRELRRLPAQTQAPVIMVSTEAQAHDAGSAARAGANAYLVKPVQPRELVLTAALLLGETATACAYAAEIEAGVLHQLNPNGRRPQELRA